jgi:hypothetical protein
MVWNRMKNEEISYGGMIRLLDLAKMKENEISIHFLTSLIHKDDEYAEIPLYVNKREDEHAEIEKVGREKIFSLNLSDEEKEYLFSVKESQKEDEFIEEYKNKFKFTMQDKYKEKYDEEDLNTIISNIYASFTDNDGILCLDRIYGPLNKGEYDCANSIDGCRMLTCCCHEEDWFEGVCDSCFKKIKDISHCLRYPVKGGGWVGCFCSMECIVKSPPYDVDEFTEIRLDCMEDVISDVGIYDRFTK